MWLEGWVGGSFEHCRSEKLRAAVVGDIEAKPQRTFVDSFIKISQVFTFHVWLDSETRPWNQNHTQWPSSGFSVDLWVATCTTPQAICQEAVKSMQTHREELQQALDKDKATHVRDCILQVSLLLMVI